MIRVAYREILARLKDWFPQIDARPIPGELHTTRGPGGDLAKLLALEDRFPEERINFIPSGAARSIDAKVPMHVERDVVARECAQCSGPRVVMHHDSFYANLVPLLPEHFSRIVFVEGSRLEPALIANERPAVVVQEFVERALMCPDLRGC